jgi:ArpU family phage transcriptional regulator
LATQNIDMAALFPEISEKATVNKVIEFFKKTFPRMVRTAGRNITDLKSPVISDMPKGDATGNTAESTITRRMVATQIVEQTRQAISHCDYRSQQIMQMLYLSGSKYYDYQVQEKIGYQETQYFYYKNKALLSFADAYLLDDLHVYK